MLRRVANVAAHNVAAQKGMSFQQEAILCHRLYKDLKRRNSRGGN